MTSHRGKLLAAAATALAMSATPALAQGGVGILMEQAGFWRAQGQPARAAAALERVLSVHPGHPDALAAAALVQVELGRATAAEGYLSRLRQAAPGDARLAGVEEAVRRGTVRSVQAAGRDDALPTGMQAAVQLAGRDNTPRLFQGARDPRIAARIAEAVLRRDPRNADARAGAIEAALALGDLPAAEVLLAEGRLLNGTDPRVSIAEARLARMLGDRQRAQTALQLAAEQRRAQIGQDAPLTVAAAPAPAPAPVPTPGRRTMLGGDGQGSSFVPQDSNPAGSAAGGVTPSQLRASDDPLLSEIGRQLAEVNQEASGRVVPNFTFRARSGNGGLERLREYGGGAEAAAPLPGVGGELIARVQGVNIDTGRLEGNLSNLRRFGTNPVALPGFAGSLSDARAAAARPRDESATGAALGLAYTRNAVTVDLGFTPLGFREQTVLGGVEFVPRLSETFQLRLRGERRSVTDSILSWSGMRDSASGAQFGGVTRSTGRGQLEYFAGRTSAYAGGGYSSITGRNVADNNRLEASAGMGYAVLRTPTQDLTTGLDVSYYAYDKNLRNFTFGQGGYFSPQTYIGASIPVDYRERIGNFAYRLGASIGVANFRERSSSVFPNNPDLQALLEQQAAADASITTRYAAQRSTQVTAGVRADAEYALTPTLRLGATARYERSADFNETRALVYARYRFDP